MSGILVVPFVGMLESLPAFVVSEREIEEVLTFTVARLAGVERQVEVAREPGGSGAVSRTNSTAT